MRQGLLLHTLYPDVEAAEGLSPPNRAEIRLYEDFIAARRGAEAASLYAHDSGRYPLTGVGDVNTYALFAESLFQLTAPQGRAGFIVPTGIATDDSTKAYFERLAVDGYLKSLLCLENEEFVFPSVHHAFRFALLTLGKQPSVDPASLVFFARQPQQIHDSRRRFWLTADEFRLINPNTRTCPVFRSQRDAELTKSLYRAAPVLIREAELDGEGKETVVQEPEQNPWGIRFSTMFHMSNDSHLFADEPAKADSPAQRLPLYEAKMIHQFDHRWATYVDNYEKPNGLDTDDVSTTQKADPSFTVRPRYWVDEREVLARIARVPSRVANAWLAWRHATDAALSDDGDEAELATLAQRRDALTLAMAAWVAGAVFRQQVTQGAPAVPAAAAGLFDAAEEPSPAPVTSVSTEGLRWNAVAAWKATQATERLMAVQHPRLLDALKADGAEGKKALPAFQKWALQDDPAQGLGLSTDELAQLQNLQQGDADSLELRFLDDWMECRSPRWLMGWRDICRSTDARTGIASVFPRVAASGSY